MARVLIAIPNDDFDPSESAIPWKYLRTAGHEVVFATQDGLPGECDPRLISGRGFGPFKSLLMANQDARVAYAAMAQSPEFRNPIDWKAALSGAFDALLLPGGHAPAVRPYLESVDLQQKTAELLLAGKPVAAICHGVLVAARALGPDGESLLFNRRTTALPKSMERSAWMLTCLWLGDYYRTYLQWVEDEVTDALAHVSQFDPGPRSLRRDSTSDLTPGFVVRDGNWLSARWPGDAHRFASEFVAMLAERQTH
ncbi:MAG: DJ-1/PfpI family protein [Rhodanobacteraceae bacterium]|jgi:protease I|nr:DJ-1/PfpI family protein [Rhodanobacteraceae bacterium]MBL0042569.1 DJ-1/PfpI family protein [Xanthomonadales bacterium]MBP6077183.1 DJ-1/PfpI family protein [Xanthomonadales bacterium]